ncbi:glycosyltransferase [Candidatus Sulfurimonas baltica]|uniref:Glycosyltransferase n=1 Tax=Candidatus Sulfurimonas baltica TaxID=2740404 RepID=A0A7S7LV40_9BACT|nr:glycosyltransferase [Candidatus Sulfurimonas baltica]QOY51423.1 glycosyltransferase [Candidatus Sulfurimonas baltica]
MKVSIIVAVYKDVESLALIIKALHNQTYKNFEVVIAEDGNSPQMQEYIKTIENLEVIHTAQEDIGVRKARSQNNGLLASSGEYLIFIDGDCIPYSNFVEGHVFLSENKTALSGRRMNIPVALVKKIREGLIDINDIENNLWKYSLLIFNKQVRFRQGIFLNPRGWIYKLISKRDISASILGCNFSCFKKDMIDINGFDESYGETAIPDDMDWEWRFKAFGLKLKSCKNVANMFHLDHNIHDRGDAIPYLKIMYERKKSGKYICEEGLNTHDV